MTAPDVAAIARGLTKAQRAALTWPKEPQLVPNTLYSQTIAAIERRGLSDPQTYHLTPLGLAIRAHLLEQQP